MSETSAWIDPRDNPTPPYRGTELALASSEAEIAELIAACKEGRLYDVERWIKFGRPLQLSPNVEDRVRSKPTALSVSTTTGALYFSR